MAVKIYSCLISGLQGQLVEVEADILQGLSAFTIVGLGDIAVQESKERIRSAIKNTKVEYPQQKKVINLAPASLKKHGPLFDLPIAISLLAASKQLPPEHTDTSIFVGELALNGQLRPVANAVSIALFAKQHDWNNLFLPAENAKEASFVKGITIFPVSHLQQLIDHLRNKKLIQPWKASEIEPIPICSVNKNNFEADFSFIQGQEQAKRALQISAAGAHHLLLYGVPGVGKTLLAKALTSLLPPLTEKEMFETIQIYSSAALVNHQNPFTIQRPFRQIHHTSSLISIVGGGKIIRPGEISLAHNGILFLDEIAEFPRSHIEALRQPLEERKIHLSRSGMSISFPANFTLVAAMNPCPCGYFGDPVKTCICPPVAILNYHKKLSGPLLDRLDLTVSLSRQRIDLLKENQISAENDSIKEKKEQQILNSLEPSAGNTKSTISAATKPSLTLKEEINFARNIQIKRYKGTNFYTNSQLNSQNISQFVVFENDAKNYIKELTEKLDLSARGYLHLIKVAQTIADLNQHNKIKISDLAESFQYRQRPWK